MRSLYSRVLLITLAAILVSSLLGFMASNIYYHIKLKPYNDDKLVAIVQEIGRFAEKHPESLNDYLENAAALGYEIYTVDEQGRERYYGHPFREKDLSGAARQSVLEGNVYHGVADFPNHPFITGFFENASSNTVGVPIQAAGVRMALFLRPNVLLQFGELRTFFALLGLLTVIFSVVIFLFSTRYLVRPITTLSQATKQIAQGRYELGLPVGRRDEIGQLAAHFMTMSRTLEKTDSARRQFVANVSHEIQSPLAAIQGYAQLLKDKALPDEERERCAFIIEQESRQLSQLSKQLLQLSSLEHGEEALNAKPVQLRDQLRKTAQTLEWQLARKEIAIKLSVPEGLQVLGDEVLLMQVWMNLIGNAVQHIPEGRAIEVQAERKEGRCIVRIIDNGNGIAEEHLAHLFDRFYRVDRARERTEGRTGLGLSIARKIVQLHRGTITVNSRPGEGTTFTVELPQL